LVLGHEAVGTVEGRPGRFTVFPLVACGRCAACRRGEENLCHARGLLGLDRAGVFADAVGVTEEALVPIPDGVDDRCGVLVEPLATGFSALELEGVSDGDVVLVVGCGPIGLLAIYAAKARGAHVLAVEPVPHRRSLAVDFGADEVSADVADIAERTADVAIDAVGVTATWSGAIRAVRSGGRVVVLGLGQASGEMPVGELVRRGVTVRGHYAYRRRDFEGALRLLAERPVDPEWITVIPLERGAEAFASLTGTSPSDTKILINLVA
jgi:threonine dehydrogenase-like Zn-dependent dehydrogenase